MLNKAECNFQYFNAQFIGLCMCVASGQADLQPGEVLLQLEEDQDQDLCHGPTGQEAGQQTREGRQVSDAIFPDLQAKLGVSGGEEKKNIGGRTQKRFI